MRLDSFCEQTRSYGRDKVRYSETILNPSFDIGGTCGVTLCHCVQSRREVLTAMLTAMKGSCMILTTRPQFGTRPIDTTALFETGSWETVISSCYTLHAYRDLGPVARN